MAYCSRCGIQNPEDAQFCNKCGASLRGTPRPRPKDPGKECENECNQGSKGTSVFWAAIVIVIGVWFLFEYGIKNILGPNDMPDWLYNFEFCWIVPVLIGIAIISAGVRMLIKNK